jgi:hypothetical protein
MYIYVYIYVWRINICELTAIVCDHTIDTDVQKAFAQIEKDHGTNIYTHVWIYVHMCYLQMYS